MFVEDVESNITKSTLLGICTLDSKKLRALSDNTRMTNIFTMNINSNIFIGLGSNVGDREGFLQLAISQMKRQGIWSQNVSSIYQSEAWGYEDQPPFLNLVMNISTLLPPQALLTELKKIEKKTGRQDREKWHEREIDLDILFYQQKIILTSSLQVPHPYISQRRFVLAPLAEIDSQFKDPLTGKTIQILLEECQDESKVELYKLFL